METRAFLLEQASKDDEGIYLKKGQLPVPVQDALRALIKLHVMDAASALKNGVIQRRTATPVPAPHEQRALEKFIKM